MCLKFSRWIRILLDSELSKVDHLSSPERLAEITTFGWIKKTYIAALLCYYTRSIQTYASWVEQQVNYTTGRRCGWMKRLCAISPAVGQLDRLTHWVDEAVIIIRPALWYHPFTIYTCILALLVEKIFEVTPTSPKALTCWISQILNIHFTCIEYL